MEGSGCTQRSESDRDEEDCNLLGKKRQRSNTQDADDQGKEKLEMAQDTDERSMSYELLLFDLDGTLYSQHCGYATHITKKVLEFMKNVLGIENAEEVQERVFKKYNQTLRGLKAEGYEFDNAHYWESIMVGREQFLSEDKELQEALEALPQRKWIFTNASEGHARACLEVLGVTSYFEGIIGADFLGDVCKPETAAFSKVIDHLKINPNNVVMFEDSFKNLEMAKQLGMGTVYLQEPDKTHLHEAIPHEEWHIFDAVIPKVSAPCLEKHFSWLLGNTRQSIQSEESS